MTNGTRSVSNLKIFLKKKEEKEEHNCDARYHTGRRNVITLFMMLFYSELAQPRASAVDGKLYGRNDVFLLLVRTNIFS